MTRRRTGLYYLVVFLRVYSKNPLRIYLILTVAGFTHLSVFYAYRAYAYFYHPAVYLEWISCLR